jgi:4-amino-4-deoxy-L-arabinose transferase-like glycosyltransferase
LRIKASNDRQPGVWLAVAAGLCGSMIVLVKPYYAIMIVVPALYVAWRKRSVRWLFTAEYWTILCFALYLQQQC